MSFQIVRFNVLLFLDWVQLRNKKLLRHCLDKSGLDILFQLCCNGDFHVLKDYLNQAKNVTKSSDDKFKTKTSQTHGSRAGLFRTPISGGVQSATSAHCLPRPALAVRNLMEQVSFAHLAMYIKWFIIRFIMYYGVEELLQT